MRVVHIISGLTRGGAETFLSRLAPRLLDRGVQSVVVSLTTDEPLGDNLRRDGVPVLALDMTMPRPPLREVELLWRSLKIASPDVVMTWLPHADLIGGVIARLRHVPVVWNLRSSMADRDPSVVHRGLIALQRRTSRTIPSLIICVSTAALAAHSRIGFDTERMRVIHNGFDTEAFRPDPDARRVVRFELGVDERTTVVGQVARIDPVKDHETGLRAFAHFRRSRPDAVLVLCGLGTDRLPTELANVVRSIGLEQHVRLLGLRTDVPRLTASFDVAMCSSRFEGLSNAVGEAMSCDVPVASTSAGDALDLVGATGLVVPVGDAVALGGALVELLEPGRLSPRQRILDMFSLDAAADAYAKCLTDVRLPA